MNRQLIYIILLNLICFTGILCSCSNTKKCHPFDYSKFNIDTTDVMKNQVFVNGGDTLLFVVEDFIIVSKKVSTPSFMTMDECNNGYYITYRCKEIGVNYNLYFIRKSSGYEFGTYSYFHHETIEGVKSIDDLGIKISSNKKEVFVQTLSFTNGNLSFFIDLEGRRWIRL